MTGSSSPCTSMAGTPPDHGFGAFSASRLCQRPRGLTGTPRSGAASANRRFSSVAVSRQSLAVRATVPRVAGGTMASGSSPKTCDQDHTDRTAAVPTADCAVAARSAPAGR